MEKLSKESLAKCLSLDAHNLFRRVDERKEDALAIFSSTRERGHFDKLFRSKYYDVSLEAMAVLQPITISLFNDFYEKMDDLKWYLLHTGDMVPQIEDLWSFKLAQIRKSLDELEVDLASYFSEGSQVESEPPHIPSDETELDTNEY